MKTIEMHQDCVRIIKSGGKAFPSDYSWECSKGHISRAYEHSCYSCEMDKRNGFNQEVA